MKLTISTVDAPTENVPWDLSPVINELQHKEEAYFILAASEFDFLQGSASGSEGYHLEFFQTDVDGHYASKVPLRASVVSEIANRYRRGAGNWKDLCEWDYHEPLEEVVDGNLGNFEGVALRHVLRELERNNIPCMLERSEQGFSVFVSPDNEARGRDLIRGLFPL